MSDEPAVPTASNDPQGPATAVRASAVDTGAADTGDVGADAAGAEQVPPKPDPFTAKWYRNPFVVSFFAGVLTLTWLKARLTYRPEPPPVVGTLAMGDWTDDKDHPVSREAFAESVTVVGFVGAEGEDCGAQHLLSKLWYMFEEEGVDARVATVGLGAGDAKTWSRNEGAAGGERVGWLQAGPTTQEGAVALRDSLAAAKEPWASWREQNPRPPARLVLPDPPECDGPEALGEVVLVDAAGNIRGFFETYAWEVESEIFHRAQHVLQAQAPE